MPATVWVKPLNDSWQPVGGLADQGVWHEDLVAVSDQWGPKSLTFTLKRQARAVFPDLLTQTPVVVEEGSIVVWRGRIKDVPEQSGAARQLTVQCEGGQFLLDDDALERILVHSDLTAYKDNRTLLASTLTSLTQSWNVQTDNGVITLGITNGAVIGNATGAAATLDLGPANLAKRVVLTWDGSNNSGTAVAFLIRGSDSPDASNTGSSQDVGGFNLNAGASGTAAGTFTTGHRYVHLLLYATVGFTSSADVWLRIKSSLTVTDTAYEASNASVLSAKMIITDTIARTSLAAALSSDQTGIGDPTLAFPDFAPDAPMSPRDLITAANAPHGWRFKIDEQLRPQYRALATTPVVELGAWLGSEGDNGSSNSDEGIVTKVLVAGTGPDGLALRSTGAQSGTIIDRQGGVRAKSLTTNFKLNQTVADKFRDTYLVTHRLSPFKGQNVVTYGGARRTDNGIAIRPAHMLLLTSERARRSDLIDPDTGALGRTAVIDQVTYTGNDETAQLDLDNTRRDFEALQERLGLLVPA